MSLKLKLMSLLLFCFYAGGLHSDNNEPVLPSNAGDTNKVKASNEFPLDKDEAIKCSRGDLLNREFVVVGDKNFPEILRITFQDLERGSREIIFQKKIKENDEVRFTVPHDLIKETSMAVLIVMKGEGMFFKKIDIVDEP
jgi:hypothetical protein